MCTPRPQTAVLAVHLIRTENNQLQDFSVFQENFTNLTPW